MALLILVVISFVVECLVAVVIADESAIQVASLLLLGVGVIVKLILADVFVVEASVVEIVEEIRLLAVFVYRVDIVEALGARALVLVAFSPRLKRILAFLSVGV